MNEQIKSLVRGPGCISSLKGLSTKFVLITKGKEVILQRRRLADMTLIK